MLIWHIFIAASAFLWLSGVTPAQQEASTVNGKQNLANLSGSIAVIEEVAAMLSDASIEKASAADGEKKK